MKIVAIVLFAVLVVVILGTVGFLGVNAGLKMINQHYAFGDAVQLAWDDYTVFIAGIFAKAQADDYFEMDYTINKYIELKGYAGL